MKARQPSLFDLDADWTPAKQDAYDGAAVTRREGCAPVSDYEAEHAETLGPDWAAIKATSDARKQAAWMVRRERDESILQEQLAGNRARTRGRVAAYFRRKARRERAT